MRRDGILPATLSPGLHLVTRDPTWTTTPDTQLAADSRTLGRFKNSSVSVLSQTQQKQLSHLERLPASADFFQCKPITKSLSVLMAILQVNLG